MALDYAITPQDKKYGAALVFLTLIYFLSVKFNAHPLEDAAMLMRYAQHLAQGHGIVWNIGEKPLDGATDFLFLLAVGAGGVVGVPIPAMVRLLGIASHLLTIMIVYLGVRRSNPSSPPSEKLAFISAAYLAGGPGLCYISAYFGTPFFALWSALTWYFATQIAFRDKAKFAPLAFAASALLMSLTRPEGVFLTVFMLMALIYWHGVKETASVLRSTAILFALIGGSYFVWRWHYFGHPLPNAYYKKGAQLFYGASVGHAFDNIVLLCLPFILPFILAFRSKDTSRPALFALIPVLGWTLIWVLLSNEMNYQSRFQYAILPVVLMSWPRLVQTLQSEWNLPHLSDFKGKNRTVAVCANVLLFAFMVGYQFQCFLSVRVGNDGLYTAGRMLREYKEKNYTLATTEAGLLPYYSEWRAIDTWGLNDAWIAHHGHITEEYLDRYKPDILVLHTPLKTTKEETTILGHDATTWGGMVTLLRHYARKRNYMLAAAYGISPESTHCYYVRPDCPDSAELILKLRQLDYTSETGQIWYNFADNKFE